MEVIQCVTILDLLICADLVVGAHVVYTFVDLACSCFVL